MTTIKKHIYLILIFIIAILSSCSTPRAFTTIDVLRPAEVTFRPEVKNVVIVINAVPQPDNIGHIILKDYKEIYESLKFDSAAVFCAASLRENLEMKGFFNSVHLSTINRNKSNNFLKINPLNKNDIRELCKEYNAEAVISLDHIYTEDKTGTWYAENNSISAIDITIKTNWTINYPSAEITPSYVQFEDSVSWESYSPKKLPMRYNALVDATILAGSNVADRLIPHWEQYDRVFYDSKNSIMKQAMDALKHRKWKAAIETWNKIFDTEKNNLMFQAANNIAIVYEILQDYNNAIKYTKKAIDIYPKVTFMNSAMANNIYELMDYINYLEKRKIEVKVLNHQLAEDK